MSFLKLAKDRYSVRDFQKRPIEPEKLNEILEAGRVAPTACNSQPQRIKVIDDPDGLAKVRECTRFHFGAPTVILVCCDKSVCWERKLDGALSGEVDASIVTTHLMMAAHDLGLGSCWVMHFDPAKTAEVFALPENIIPVAFLPIGYPAENAAPSALHSKRLALNDILI